MANSSNALSLPAPLTGQDNSDPRFWWTMYYRHGMNPSLQKNFYFEGTMTQAIERAQKHCAIMGFKYSWLRPMISNLELEEGIQLGIIDRRTGLPFPKKEGEL
jgi:hypothetical protein